MGHGTATAVATLEIATGKVAGKCCWRHRNDELVLAMKVVAKTNLHRQLHLIIDGWNARSRRGLQPSWSLGRPVAPLPMADASRGRAAS